MMNKIEGTTILGIVKDGKAVLGGDGQVTFGNIVMKGNARKVRKLYNDTVLAGFAGSVADAFTLFDRFEEKLSAYRGQLMRAVVELAREWRTDKYLRHLEAMLVVMDKEKSFIVSGSGEVIEPEGGIVSIGSGSMAAIAAAKALMENTDMDIREIVEKSLHIAGNICIYTNTNIIVEEI